VTRGPDYVCRWIETHCRLTSGSMAGKPFRLLDWQREVIADAVGDHRALRPRDRRSLGAGRGEAATGGGGGGRDGMNLHGARLRRAARVDRAEGRSTCDVLTNGMVARKLLGQGLGNGPPKNGGEPPGAVRSKAAHR
jgi:hypothetical protein